MVNKSRNNLKWYKKTNISQVINNGGLSSKSVYKFLQWGNKSQQYHKDKNNVSCWGNMRKLGIISDDKFSKYAIVKQIQLQQGKKDRDVLSLL